MKILVFDDTQKHRDAAVVSLQEHTVTVVGTYDEAQQALLAHPYDAVLTDLFVPASKQNQGPKGYEFVGQEMPLGSIIALLAISKGVKRVAVVTDMDHHQHPAAAAFDCFEKDGGSAGDVRVLCTNYAICTVDESTFERVEWEYLQSPEGKTKYPSYKGTTLVKDWRQVLESLCS